MSTPDSHYYYGVSLRTETIRLFVDALRFYAAALESDIESFRIDPELAKLLDEENLRSFQISQELKLTHEYANRFEEMWEASKQFGDTDTGLSHGMVRRPKSVSLLYLTELERRRDSIAASRDLTSAGLEALDTELAQLQEKMTLGVFRDAEPLPLMVEQVEASAPAASGSKAETAFVHVPAKIATSRAGDRRAVSALFACRGIINLHE